MRKSDLPECPHWLAEAETIDENVTWYADMPGTWIIWHSGLFRGAFRGGAFRGGAFLGGEFLGGAFRGGAFLGGAFLGGEFLGGEFRGGAFRGGAFLGGAFLGGSTWIRPFWHVLVHEDGQISVGCKRKTRAEWDAWFAGTEVYSHQRNTDEFRRIHGSYRALCVWLDTVNPPKAPDVAPPPQVPDQIQAKAPEG
jgi:hypothetical protein